MLLVGASFRTFGGVSTNRYEIIGAVLIVLAILVVVQSIRERRKGSTRIPLPLILVGVGLMFDVLITLGRLGFGDATNTQYVMPQTFLLTGLVVFGVGCLPSGSGDRSRSVLELLGYLILVVLVVSQTVIATDLGLRQANAMKQSALAIARVDVVATLPTAVRASLLHSRDRQSPPRGSLENALFALELRDLQQDQLSLFQPASYRQLQAEGLPRIPVCERHLA